MTNDDRNSRRAFLGRTAGLGTAVFAQRSVRAAGTRPNIIYIHSHDSGRYLQPYGFNVPTPNLQKLASEGVLFRRAFSAAPTCSPVQSPK